MVNVINQRSVHCPDKFHFQAFLEIMNMIMIMITIVVVVNNSDCNQSPKRVLH